MMTLASNAARLKTENDQLRKKLCALSLEVDHLATKLGLSRPCISSSTSHVAVPIAQISPPLKPAEDMRSFAPSAARYIQVRQFGPSDFKSSAEVKQADTPSAEGDEEWLSFLNWSKCHQ